MSHDDLEVDRHARQWSARSSRCRGLLIGEVHERVHDGHTVPTLSLGLNEPDAPEREPPPPEDDGGPRPFAIAPPPLPARPPAILFSGVLHALAMAGLISRIRASGAAPVAPTSPVPATPRVFLPVQKELRAALGLPPMKTREVARDRISVGAPSSVKRAKVLRREDDYTKAPKGERQTTSTANERREAVPDAPLVTAPPVSSTTGNRAYLGREQARPRLRLDRAIARAVEAVGSGGRWGDPSGSQSAMGLQFDPQGADFSLWMQRFKDEVYRNWITPTAARWGLGGQVVFEFVVQRNGDLTSLALLSGTGAAGLDNAARNALASSRLLRLPEDYAPPQITMRVAFNYGPPPGASRGRTGRGR